MPPLPLHRMPGIYYLFSVETEPEMHWIWGHWSEDEVIGLKSSEQFFPASGPELLTARQYTPLPHPTPGRRLEDSSLETSEAPKTSGYRHVRTLQ